MMTVPSVHERTVGAFVSSRVTCCHENENHERTCCLPSFRVAASSRYSSFRRTDVCRRNFTKLPGEEEPKIFNPKRAAARAGRSVGAAEVLAQVEYLLPGLPRELFSTSAYPARWDVSTLVGRYCACHVLTESTRWDAVSR